MAITIQLRRDTAANWTAANPTLAAGEPALETDTGNEKIGDGVTAWNSLPYKNSGTGTNGWTPQLALVTDGIRRVQQVIDWTGGTGTKPPVGLYVGASGLVADIVDAVTIGEAIAPKSWGFATRPTNPAVGLMGYNTDSQKPEIWDGTAWRKLTLTPLVTGWEGIPFSIAATPAPSFGNVGYNTVFAGALPSPYTTSGFTPTFSGNDLVINKSYDPAGYNIVSSNYINLADNYKYTLNFKYLGAAAAEYALGVFIRSINADFAQSIFGHMGLATGTNAGKTIIANNPEGTQFSYVSTGAPVSLNAGNEMKFEFERKDFFTFVCTITNLTTSQVNTVTWTNMLGSGLTTGSTGKIEILAAGCNIAVHSESFVVNEKQHENLATIGDSITWGQSASNIYHRYANLINVPAAKKIVIGNGGDGLVELLAGLGQILALQPKAVTIMMGGNDLLFNRSSATWQGAYNSICTQLRAAGIKIIHLCPTPRDLHSVLPLVNFIRSTYSTTDFVITDTYYALRDGTQDKLNPAYAGADNLPHPNDAGMAKVAEIVNAILEEQLPSLLV